MVVVGKFGCQQELIPVVLFVAHEDTDELFKLLVNVLGLAIGLRVASGGGSGFNTNEAPQLSGELGDELWTMVGNVLPRGAMVHTFR
jgi:hypothetical protein